MRGAVSQRRILPQLGSGDAEGLLDSVMRIVEGESLRERLVPLPGDPAFEALARRVWI